jgi:hypothetical protein
MEFLRLSGQVVGDIAWPRQTSTSDELKQHAKAALSSFYVGNKTCFWPRKPPAPGQVRIVDGKGKALITYTINDLEFDTGRSLVREEPQLDRFGEPGISRIPPDGGGMGEDDAAIPVPGEKSNHQIDADGPNLRDRRPVG